MTDIAKCMGINCDLKETCWRFTAPSGYWQSWSPFHTEPKPCRAYWPIDKEGDKKE